MGKEDTEKPLEGQRGEEGNETAPEAETGQEKAATRPQEASEGPSQAEALYDSQTPETLQEEKNMAPKVVLAAIIVLAIAVLVIGVIFAITQKGERDGSEVGGTGADAPVEVGKPEAPKGEAVSIDDAEVRRLWEQFEIIENPWSATMHFYIAPGVERGEVDDKLMTAVALANLEPKAGCAETYEATLGWDASEYGCYDVEVVRAKAKEIFGKEVNLGDGSEPIAWNNCHGWTLSVENGELYDAIGSACGGQCVPNIVREIDRAGRAEDELYIYEKAYMEACDGIYHLGTEINTYEHGGEEKLDLMSLKLGEVIAEAEYDEDGNIVETINAEDYADQFDEFRWTFKKNAEGNYVFAGLERAK